MRIINGILKDATSVGGVLGVVSSAGDVLDSIAVSTAMSMLCKVAKRATEDKRSWKLVGDELGAELRFARLMVELVREHCPWFEARAGANVLNSLAVLRYRVCLHCGQTLKSFSWPTTVHLSLQQYLAPSRCLLRNLL